MLSAAAAGLLAGALPARPANAAEPIRLSLATATAGGGFEAYGKALAEAIAAVAPGIGIRPRPTRGSLENVALLVAGRVDLALVTGEVAHEAWLAQAVPPPVLWAMYASPGMFAVRADAPYRAIADLKGRRVVFGARGSGLVVLARHVLDGLGLDLERDFDAILLERAEDGPALVLDGSAAALWGAGAGWPPFVTLAQAGARFIVPDEEAVARVVARHAALRPLVLPAGSYPGQAEALRSVGTWSLILTRPGLDEALAHRLAEALHRCEQDLARRLPQAGMSTAANTLAAVPAARLHPGVLRYLHAAGLAGPQAGRGGKPAGEEGSTERRAR
jgi:hypothetical protein